MTDRQDKSEPHSPSPDSAAGQGGAAAPTDDLLGRKIGDYQTLRRLGSGGMADVYLAEQVSLRRKVALKVLKREFVKDATYVARFVREAQAAAGLVQPNIVQIYEVGERDGIHYIAQEYIPGRNLRQFISRFGAVQPAMAINVLRQAGLALQKAGEMGVTHRDIKPENIMLSPTGEVKVTDFGLARIETGGQKNDLTQVGIAMGTPLYMSPEQVEGRAVDHRSDLYSLGVTAWHMLAGYPPFQGENALALALQHVRTDPEELRKIRPDVPRELCSIIHRMMAKEPDQRYSSAAEFLRELKGVKIDLEGELDLMASRLSEANDDGVRWGNELPTTGLEATRQLQTLMRGNDRNRSFWNRVLAASAVLGLLGAGTGASAAWLTPPLDPLARAEQAETRTVAREADIEKQYMEAMWHNTEPHFRAVEEYFPNDKAGLNQRNLTLLYNAKAWLQLARLQMADENYLGAKQQFQKLSSAGVSQRYLQLSGKIGLAWLADHFGIELEARRQLLDMNLTEMDLVSLDPWILALLESLLDQYGRDLPGFESSIQGLRTGGQRRIPIAVPSLRRYFLPPGPVSG